MSASSPHLILYKWDHSPPSNAVRTVGSILGLQFELHELNRITREHKTPEFKKINPASSLPVLKDGDFILSESNSNTDEYRSLLENHTWEVTALPANKRPTPCKWVFKTKTNENGDIVKYKARLVIKGCSQIPGIYYTDVYSPVLSNSVILYLVEKYGGEHKAKLYPSDLRTRALVHQILFYNSFLVFPSAMKIAKSRIRGGSTGPTAEDVANIAGVFTIVEAFLQKYPYVACDHLTVADVALGITVAATNVLVPFDAERFPKIQAWLGRLMENTHFRELSQVGAAGLEEMIKFVKANKKSE